MQVFADGLLDEAVHIGSLYATTYSVTDVSKISTFAAEPCWPNRLISQDILRLTLFALIDDATRLVGKGAAFRSHHLSLVCAKIGTTLIHARPPTSPPAPQ